MPTGTQSIRRSVAILREVATYNLNGIRLVDLAANLGLERSTAHRILQCLVYEGLIHEKNPGNRYVLGPLAFELGLAARRRFDVTSIFLPHMQSLADETGDVVFLSVRSSLAITCIARVDGTYPIKAYTLDVGQRRPMGFGCVGTAMLTLMSDEEVHSILAMNAQALQTYGATTVAEAFERVTRARELGYALHARPTLGLKSIAVPVADAAGKPAAVLSICAIARRLEGARLETLAESLQRYGAAAAGDFSAHRQSDA
ncbi:MAG TPA: IclR family transcriptional regulator [Bordetella sp.]